MICPTSQHLDAAVAIVEALGQAGRSQIPNQDFRLHFNVWDTVRSLSQKLCEGKSAAEVMEEIAQYGEPCIFEKQEKLW